VSGASALTGHLRVDSPSVVANVQKKLGIAVGNFRFDFLGLGAAALPATAQRAGQHLRGLAELRRAEEVDRAAEIGVVEDVEEIGARLTLTCACGTAIQNQTFLFRSGPDISTSSDGAILKILLCSGFLAICYRGLCDSWVEVEYARSTPFHQED
jgi:hypothetical protein